MGMIRYHEELGLEELSLEGLESLEGLVLEFWGVKHICDVWILLPKKKAISKVEMANMIDHLFE